MKPESLIRRLERLERRVPTVKCLHGPLVVTMMQLEGQESREEFRERVEAASQERDALGATYCEFDNLPRELVIMNVEFHGPDEMLYPGGGIGPKPRDDQNPLHNGFF